MCRWWNISQVAQSENVRAGILSFGQQGVPKSVAISRLPNGDSHTTGWHLDDSAHLYIQPAVDHFYEALCCHLGFYHLNLYAPLSKWINQHILEDHIFRVTPPGEEGFPVAWSWKSVCGCRRSQRGSAWQQTGFVRYSRIIPLCTLPVTQWFIKICCKQFCSPLISSNTHK